MKRIIISYEDDVDPVAACAAVTATVNIGKISKARGIDHYCWIARTAGGVDVFTREKNTDGSADSFVVRRSEK